MSKIPVIKQYFNSDNLIEQAVYRANKSFSPIYINQELFERYFGKKYVWSEAKEIISDYFSLTLNQDNSTGEEVGTAYVDKQKDPIGLALNGNSGSGRAFFFAEHFNVKGDKTCLATSTNEEYNNGKLSLNYAINESIISNIISQEFDIPSFQTLAVLYKNEDFDFPHWELDRGEYTKTTKNMPCALVIRVNTDKELYRFSNAFVNNDKFSKQEILTMAEQVGKLEGEKFAKRFIHGSWSVGNLSSNSNMIDFDTSYFVKGRQPQYAVTYKYKSSYFGYEALGQRRIIHALLENGNADGAVAKQEIDKTIDNAYDEALLRHFYDLIGLDYEKHSSKYGNKVKSLAEKFNELSRKLATFNTDLCVVSLECNSSFSFDFSKLFRWYPYKKAYQNAIPLDGLALILNKSYTQDMPINQTIKEIFKEQLVTNEGEELRKVADFIREYDELLTLAFAEDTADKIVLKAFIVNEDREFLFGDYALPDLLSKRFTDKEYTPYDFNLIISTLIKLNRRDYDFENTKEFPTVLTMYKDCLAYFLLGEKHFRFVVVPFENSNIKTAQVVIDDLGITLEKTELDGNIAFVSEEFNGEDNIEMIAMGYDLIFNRLPYEKRPFEREY